MPAAPAAAQAVGTLSQQSVPKLKPGQYLWFDEAQLLPVADGIGAKGVSITISLADQRGYVYRDGQLIGVTTVSTGSRGRETPVGDYTILQKKSFHRSNLYSNAPMPFMQRLTWDGIAIHAGHLPGYPASHGCIRLPAKFAEQLYEMTEMGGSVSVVAEAVGDPSYYAPIRSGPVAPAAPRLTVARIARRDAQPVATPSLAVETRRLGGASFDVLTMPGDATSDRNPIPRPASWMRGGETHGSR